MSPLVSVLMPVRNAAAFVGQAIESILGQSLADLELLILNDGSTDGTDRILGKFQKRDARIRVIERDSIGVTRALNVLLRESRGEYLARMDADDWSLTERFGAQVAFLEHNPDHVLVGCQVRYVDETGATLTEQIRRPTTHEELDARLLCGLNLIPHPGVMLRREAAITVGGYDESYQYAQDLDFWLRLAECGKLANHADVLLAYRIHAKAISASKRQAQWNTARRAALAACQRRRRTPPAQLYHSIPQLSEDALSRQCSWMALHGGELSTARRHARRSVSSAPLRPINWLYLARAYLGLRPAG